MPVLPSPRSFTHAICLLTGLLCLAVAAPPAHAQDGDRVLRVFLFAGQSNMEGADSDPAEIDAYPPFVGLDAPQEDVLFCYCLGRENKVRSKGWEALRPVRNMVGPELSFAREVKKYVQAPIAIIKVAAGGTHLAGDWNPDQPRGFKMYPLALQWVREALADLDRRKIKYRLEGFVWHQGENDMFEEGAMPAYGANLKNFITRWRTDLNAPKLRFYIGELCTKTIWGLDLRPRMDQISRGQHQVTDADPLADFVPTSHVAVTTSGRAGLHYHYGTLGQLEHGVNHAHAYLRNLGALPALHREFSKWPYPDGSTVKVFVLAGHRNMEGERSFAQQLQPPSLRRNQAKIAFRYSLGGGYRQSEGWEPLGLVDFYDTFGPELSFGARLQPQVGTGIAIAKFTHSGSQIVDWTPQGSEAKSRNLYPSFVAFIKASLAELEAHGQQVELAGIFYHLSENDMSWGPSRQRAAQRLEQIVRQSRIDLEQPELPWFVSQQAPTDHPDLNAIDVSTALAQRAAADPHLTLIPVHDLPGAEQALVMNADGVVSLGERLADAWLETRPPSFHLDEDTGIRLRDGFDADLIYSVPEWQGSWVSMAFDPQGRLIVSDQDHKGIFRLTLPPVGAGGTPRVERLRGFPFDPIRWGSRTVGGALGLLYAFDSLYLTTLKGFYRCQDSDGDGEFDTFRLLKSWQPGWEHSAHSVIVTEDGKGLYVIAGNHTPLPDGVDTLQPRVWQEDSLLPSMPDPNGHAVGVGPLGGWICRVSPDGKDWTMIASGLRNAVDLALNREGELFTYDSDLEFDIGSPWYRSPRVNHVISAADFGWRAGSAKWPDYAADSFGAVLDTGPGSPTGISFGHGSAFPTAYQDKLFLCDWTFGAIYLADLKESGSSYTARKELFLEGSPLNITAMRFGPDGHMYFVIGGRNTASKLYRIRATALRQPGAGKVLTHNQALRDQRHALEAFHGQQAKDDRIVAQAWPWLGHADRGIRYAARLAIECQELKWWQTRVFHEMDPRTLIYGAIALCRHAGPEVLSPLLARLSALDYAALDRDDRLALLRAYALCMTRLGTPSVDDRAAVIAQLDPNFPAHDQDLDTELCRVLCSLEAPQVVAKTLALMRETHTAAMDYDAHLLAKHEYGKDILQAMANTPNTQNIHYAYCLRRVQQGWNLDRRKEYFGWLNETLRKSGGKSFLGYVRGIRQDAIAHLPAADAAAVAWLLGDIAAVDLASLPKPQGPGRSWTLDAAQSAVANHLVGRDYEHGKRMFAAGLCIACHRFAGKGGLSGPDLGAVGQRFSVDDILQAIHDPSASVSDQYAASVVHFTDGSQWVGRVIFHDDQQIGVACNPFDFSQLSKRAAAEVTAIEPSPYSLMPAGLLNAMSEEELRDLIAYLVSGGDPDHPVFR